MGYGDKSNSSEESSMHHAIMGIVIAKAMEDLYNLELWREPHKPKENLQAIVKKEFKLQLFKKYLIGRKHLKKKCLRFVWRVFVGFFIR